MDGGNSSNVLVIGDWYVDAHWVVAPHESDTASRPGDVQSLSIHEVEATVRALCGAGQVASILEAGSHRGLYGEIYGVGSWAIGDDPLIQAMMRGKNIGDNPLHLKSRIEYQPIGTKNPQRVYNLSTSAKSGTSRVIRVYRQTSSNEYKIVHRIDFETPAPSGEHRRSFHDIQKAIPDIKYILVKDHGHGIVTKDLIKELIKCYPDATWYVSTKQWNADWISELKSQKLRLVLYQYEATAKATTNDVLAKEVRHWFIDGKAPTRAALQAIDLKFRDLCPDMEYETSKNGPVVIALPGRNSLIARIPEDPAFGCFHQMMEEKQPESFMPRASALFAALFHSDVVCNDEDHWCSAIARALEFTGIWVQEEAGRISKNDWKENSARLADTKTGDACGITTIKGNPADKLHKRIQALETDKHVSFAWNHLLKEYKDSFTAWPGLGAIRRNGRMYLEVWRAMSDIPGVISVVRTKRHTLNQLSLELDRFVRSNRQHHKSFMIVDDPGGGKSTLVKQLARFKGLRVLQVNITELSRKEDLLSFFDTIVTSQAQDPTSPILVFVDEINALLDNQNVYSAFLAPLEDGHYNREGKSFTIHPCVWVFVGTEDLKQTRHQPRTVRHLEETRDQLVAEIDNFLATHASGSDRGFPSYALVEGDHEPAQVAIAGKSENSQCEDGTAVTIGLKHSSPLTEFHTKTERESYEASDRTLKKSDFLSRLTSPPFLLNEALTVGDEIRNQMPVLCAELKKLRDQVAIGNDFAYEELLELRGRQLGNEPAQYARLMILSRMAREGQALERIYIGTHMITSMHPEVTRISLRVLKAFAMLEDSFTFRDLRHDLERLVNVQRGEVKWHNLPARFHQHTGIERVANGKIVILNSPRKPLDQLCPEDDDATMVEIVRSVSQSDSGWTGMAVRD
ncbi:MAG: AAA family ATPase [Fimbriimonadaceae bacterium]|nr:AAA family ATPase [Fimbriimonadaceae bacterium]